MIRRALALASLLTSTLAAQTYAKDVAPILIANCVDCHRPGEAAPFSLLTYRDAKTRAKQIAAVTQSRYMPPWLPEHGDGILAGERRLTPAQIKLIRDWAAAGAPEGDPNQTPPMPRFTEGWQLGKPDLILTLDSTYALRADGGDVFRNFIFPVPISATKYVRAVEIRPGNKKIVHHANLLIDPAGVSRAKNNRDGQPGFPGMDVKIESSTFDPDSHFLFWKPGTSAVREPDDMAWILRPGSDLVLNMHLQPSGKPESLQPSIGLYFTSKAPSRSPILVQLEHDGALDIPAGTRDFTITDKYTLPTDADLLGIYPHAHYIGKDLRGEATLPDGTRRTLIHIPDWNINWQAVYYLKQPLTLPKGTTISMRFTYDNSASNPRNPSHPPVRVVNGDRSIDEMGHLWLQLLPRGDQDKGRMTLQRAVLEARLQKYPSDFFALYSLGALSQTEGDARQAFALYQKAMQNEPGNATVHNSLGALLQQSGQWQAAAEQFAAALKLNPDYADAHYNLARTLLMTEQYAPAVDHLRSVLRLNANDAIAMSDLGAALQITGQTAEGLRYLRQAAQLRPDYYTARFNLGQALAAAGDRPGARAEFQAALALKPNDTDARQALREISQ